VKALPAVTVYLEGEIEKLENDSGITHKISSVLQNAADSTFEADTDTKVRLGTGRQKDISKYINQLLLVAFLM